MTQIDLDSNQIKLLCQRAADLYDQQQATESECTSLKNQLDDARRRAKELSWELEAIVRKIAGMDILP